jgi:murein DD-endopeptidase MepM/ murein hydrolase activator NlpD
MGDKDRISGIRGVSAAILSRRRLVLASVSVLCFLALFPGSTLQTSPPSSPAMGGAAFPASMGAPAAAVEDDRGLYYSVHVVVKGDTIGDLADSFGVTTDSIVSFNDIRNARSIPVGQLLKIPSQAGILYTIKKGDSLESVSVAYGISADSIVEANGLMSDRLEPERVVFLPDARLPSFRLREINGDLFRWPVSGGISSRYGWRTDPFSGSRTFHNGLDIASWMGSPVRAAMEGRVSETGYSASFGNYILIAHHSGYASFYGHLSSIGVRSGQAVSLGQVIGAVGSTGYSTGPHLHFTVFKYGSTVNPAILLH